MSRFLLKVLGCIAFSLFIAVIFAKLGILLNARAAQSAVQLVESDPFEPDDTCTQASLIQVDGSLQLHTFSSRSDNDWIRFNALSGATYRIEVTLPTSSTADAMLLAYAGCDNSLAEQNFDIRANRFSKSAVGFSMRLGVSVTGPLYIQVLPTDTSGAGTEAAYSLSVTETKKGALIIVAGRRRPDDPLQTNIDNVAENVAELFKQHDFQDYNIYFLATDNSLPGFDAPATLANLQEAITTWSVSHLHAGQPLSIYFIGHGGSDLFYIDGVNEEYLTPNDLDFALSMLETKTNNPEINVIIDTDKAGSFIESPATISKPGRLIIASTSSDGSAFASAQGAIFSDIFLEELGIQDNLKIVFENAKLRTQNIRSDQQAELDANGNSIVNESTDLYIADQHSLFSGHCYPLVMNWSGKGSPPQSTPVKSSGCAVGSFTSREEITLQAVPDLGWQVGSWSGTDNDASKTLSNTLTMPAANHTVTVNYIAKPSGDAYESDGTCQQARLIATDGLFQEHTFHQPGDIDWLTFDAIKDATYLIEVQMPSDSSVNVVMDTSKDCSSSTLGPTWDNPYTRGVRMSRRAPITGRLYIRLNNKESAVAGPQVRYRIAVTLKESTTAVGALIIVAGRYRFNDGLQPHIFHVANDAYDFFAEQGYTDEHIYYLTADDFQMASDLQSSRYDAPATLQNLGFAITEWAKARVDDKRMLTLYLVDHGYTDLFYLDQVHDQSVSPTQLNEWLTKLEAVTPGLKINIIIEACKSGSFLKTLSKPNRLVITSTSADKDAITSENGAHFSDQFLASLRQGSTLYSSFQLARENARIFLDDQDAWLDANGNGIPNEQADEVIAAQVGLLTSYTSTNELWPPQINTLQLTSEISGTRATIRTTVSDNGTVSGVWVVIIPPSAATPPETANQLIPDNALPMTTVNSVLGQYQLDYNDFSEAGTYRIVVYAEDDDGLTSQPFAITVESEGLAVKQNVFLPLVAR